MVGEINSVKCVPNQILTAQNVLKIQVRIMKWLLLWTTSFEGREEGSLIGGVAQSRYDFQASRRDTPNDLHHFIPRRGSPTISPRNSLRLSELIKSVPEKGECASRSPDLRLLGPGLIASQSRLSQLGLSQLQQNASPWRNKRMQHSIRSLLLLQATTNHSSHSKSLK